MIKRPYNADFERSASMMSDDLMSMAWQPCLTNVGKERRGAIIQACAVKNGTCIGFCALACGWFRNSLPTHSSGPVLS
eukprot:5472477-Amphidinium_carterae.1